MRKIIFNTETRMQDEFSHFEIHLNDSLMGITQDKYFFIEGDGPITVKALFCRTAPIENDVFTIIYE